MKRCSFKGVDLCSEPAWSLLALLVLVGLSLATTATALGQDHRLNLAQRLITERMIREQGGTSPSVRFNDDDSFSALNQNETRVQGSGVYYRDDRDRGRNFEYDAVLDVRRGELRTLNYTFSDRDGGGGGEGAGQSESARRSCRTAVLAEVRSRFGNRSRGDIKKMDLSSRFVSRRLRFEGTVEYRDYTGRHETSFVCLADRSNGNVLRLSLGGEPVDDEDGGRDTYRSGQLRWRGTVDDRTNLLIRGSRVSAQWPSGTPYYDGSSNFTGSLPRVATNVRVRKLRGRGDVRVIQQPSQYNDFTATIQIYDDKRGADRYEIEVSW
jgi:hypothetical protein